MNLNDFLSTLRTYTKFTDPDVQSDATLIGYVRMAEERLSADLRIGDMIQIDTAQLTDSRVSMPPTFRSMDFMRILGGNTMDYKTREEFYADPRHQQSTKYFTTSGMFLIVGGSVSPTAPLSVEMHYFGDVETLTESNESWVSRRYPRLLMFATMEVASLGVVNPEAATDWGARAKSLIDRMNADYQISIAQGSRLQPKRRTFG